MAATPDDVLHTFEHGPDATEVAERILELADGTRSVAQIAEQLCEEFEVAVEDCRRDTLAFVELLVRKKILITG